MRRRFYFVCIGNSHRSQMAEAFARHHGGDAVDVRSGGSRPAGHVAPEAVEVMRERGIDISRAESKKVDWEWGRGADVVLTMGCGDECPAFLGAKTRDWDLPDPKGQSVEFNRKVRDDIERRVVELLREFGVPPRSR